LVSLCQQDAEVPIDYHSNKLMFIQSQNRKKELSHS